MREGERKRVKKQKKKVQHISDLELVDVFYRLPYFDIALGQKVLVVQACNFVLIPRLGRFDIIYFFIIIVTYTQVHQDISLCRHEKR